MRRASWGKTLGCSIKLQTIQHSHDECSPVLSSKGTLTQDLTYDLCPQEAHILVNTFYPLDILERQPNLGHVRNVGGKALAVIQSSHLSEVRLDAQKGCGFRNKFSDGQWTITTRHSVAGSVSNLASGLRASGSAVQQITRHSKLLHEVKADKPDQHSAHPSKGQ